MAVESVFPTKLKQWQYVNYYLLLHKNNLPFMKLQKIIFYMLFYFNWHDNTSKNILPTGRNIKISTKTIVIHLNFSCNDLNKNYMTKIILSTTNMLICFVLFHFISQLLFVKVVSVSWLHLQQLYEASANCHWILRLGNNTLTEHSCDKSPQLQISTDFNLRGSR